MDYFCGGPYLPPFSSSHTLMQLIPLTFSKGKHWHIYPSCYQLYTAWRDPVQPAGRALAHQATKALQLRSVHATHTTQLQGLKVKGWYYFEVKPAESPLLNNDILWHLCETWLKKLFLNCVMSTFVSSWGWSAPKTRTGMVVWKLL